MRQSLFADALAVPASWPAARPPLAFLQLLLGPADAAFSGHLLLGVLHPADELVASQRRDVLPSIKRRRVGDQRDAQVCGKLVHYPARHWLAAHKATVPVQNSDALTCRDDGLPGPAAALGPLATGGPSARASPRTRGGSPARRCGASSESLPVDRHELTGVQFVSGSTGWVAGWDQILGTDDGGRHWVTEYRTTAAAALASVDFADRTHGWAVGASTILVTVDGGRHWRGGPPTGPRPPTVAFCRSPLRLPGGRG